MAEFNTCRFAAVFAANSNFEIFTGFSTAFDADFNQFADTNLVDTLEQAPGVHNVDDRSLPAASPPGELVEAAWVIQ